MALKAAVLPILPDKVDEWRRFVAELNGSRRKEFVDSRRAIGAHERTFLQHTPMGDMVIVTLEADDPGQALSRFANSPEPFAVWFRERVRSIHGVDLAEMTKQPMPDQVVDSWFDSDMLSSTKKEPVAAGSSR